MPSSLCRRRTVILRVATPRRLTVKRPKRSLRDEATDLVLPTQDDFELDLAARCRDAVRATIQVVLDEELERLVGAGRYERTGERVDVRNGSYPRRVVTATGEVALNVGPTRAGRPP